MFVLILLLVLVFSLANVDCGVEFQIGSKGKQANLDRFDGTCGRRDLKYSMTMDSLDSDGANVYCNYTIHVNETIPDVTLRYKVTIKRCLSKENPDSCENFYVYNSKNYCDLVSQQNNPLWSPFFSNIQPPMKCPIKKGRYRGVNCKVSVGAFLMFPAAGYYWKTTLQLTRESGQMIMCVLAETQITISRSSSLF